MPLLSPPSTDLRQIAADLRAFYDFRGRTVVAVGAGGGQTVESVRGAHKVIAVDKDLLDVQERGDVVLFEFCLRLMDDPDRALAQARGLAADVVVIDHAPGSRWSWYAAEDLGVEACWRAVERAGIRTQMAAEVFQRFADDAALRARLASQGAASRQRLVPFRRQRAITIRMPYRLALLAPTW